MHDLAARFPGLAEPPPADPLAVLAGWIEEARAAGVPEPTAMALATVSADGWPANRLVLCRGVDPDGVRFFTDRTGAKAADLAAVPRAAVVFAWDPPQRQVRIVGSVERLGDADSDDYFARRPRPHRIAAWASAQSRPVADRAALEARRAAVEARFADAEVVPRPPDWGGYRIVARSVEIWAGHHDRLHDRFLYTRAPDGAWVPQRLMP